MTRPVWTARALVLAALLTAFLLGCTGQQGAPRSAAPIPPRGVRTVDSPEQVIRDFYAALAARDATRAEALMTVHGRGEQAASDYNVLPRISIDHLSIGRIETITADASRPDYLKGYSVIMETQVRYDLLEKTPFEDPGRQVRFVIVAQETTGTPWRIDGTGTGP